MKNIGLFACLVLIFPLAGAVRLPVRPSGAQTPASPTEQNALDNRLLTRLREGGDLFRARQYGKALQILREGYESATTAGRKDLGAKFLANIGSIHFARQQFQAALEALVEAQSLAASSGDLEVAAGTCINISSVYKQMGDLPSAVAWAERGLRVGEAARHTPKLLIHLATLRAHQGHSGEAILLFHQGIEAADRVGDLDTYAIGWDRLGEAYLKQSDLPRAEIAMLEAYRVRKLFRRPALDSSYRNLGLLKLAQTDYRSASTLLGEAVRPSVKSQGLMPEWVVLHAQGRLYLAQGRLSEALGKLRSAIRLARQWRKHAPAEDSARIGMEGILEQAYAGLVHAGGELYLKTGRQHFAEQAFEAAEENRAASLRLLLAEREHTQQIFTGEAGLLRETCRNLPADAAYLGFHLGLESYVWALDRAGFSAHRLPSKENLSEAINRFSASVRDGDPEAAPQGEALFQTLFGALPKRFHRCSRWFLALDAELFRLPMAALVVAGPLKRPVYLIERHSLQIVSGAGLMLSEIRKPREEVWDAPFVGVADPVYNLADPRLPRSIPRPNPKGWRWPFRLFAASGEDNPQNYMPRLPASAHEIELCARAWGVKWRSLQGLEASRDNVHSELKAPRSVIHFATHMLESQGRIRQAQIALSLNRNGRGELLGPAEIASWSNPVQVVVLSGCSSGSADALPGTGLMGLTRAWLASGAGSVVASRWPTPDDTGELFLRFYKYLRKIPEHGPADALQQAQIDLRGSAGWRANPRYWGAYFVMSNR